METLTCRLLPYAVADGPVNMAADEILLQAASEGIASLRFYGWSQATVSLGYFQPAAVRLDDARLAMLPWVRRATGGATLVHHHELTYALAVPPGPPWQTRESWMPRMHGIILRALEGIGLRGKIAAAETPNGGGGAHLCFQQVTRGDLWCGGHKVVGSAQRKHRQSLLQHGAILLRQSEATPGLPGIIELTTVELPVHRLIEAITEHFRIDTSSALETGDWLNVEIAAIDELAQVKYRSTAWNEKR